MERVVFVQSLKRLIVHEFGPELLFKMKPEV